MASVRQRRGSGGALLRGVTVGLLRPLLRLAFGLSMGGRERLPTKGPAIVAANHNSHLDILFLLCAFRRRALPEVVPLAAADYFMATGWLRVIARDLIGILPIERNVRRGSADPLDAARAALRDGKILLVFPEGTRGRPEEIARLKGGLSKLAVEADLPIVPVYLQGAGRILPKGSRIPVPFGCTLLVGEPIRPTPDRAALMAELRAAFERLRNAAPPLHWH